MITIGTKVAILPSHKYNNKFSGMTGIVRYSNYNEQRSYGVEFNSIRNPDSKYGLFWFDEDDLGVFSSEPIDMSLYINKIIFNGPKTIIIWNDKTKTVVSCCDGDTFDLYAGFCAAITKKVFGSTSKAKKTLDKYYKG